MYLNHVLRQADKQKAEEAGFDQYMTNPLELQSLVKFLASLPPRH